MRHVLLHYRCLGLVLGFTLAPAVASTVVSLLDHNPEGRHHGRKGRARLKVPHVDSAHYRSVEDPVRSVDVTDQVNMLLETNGPKDFTGGKAFDDIFGDPSWGDAKMLSVTAGGKSVNLQGGVTPRAAEKMPKRYNLFPLLSSWFQEAEDKEAELAAAIAADESQASDDGGIATRYKKRLTKHSGARLISEGLEAAAADKLPKFRKKGNSNGKSGAAHEPVVMGYQDLSRGIVSPSSDGASASIADTSAAAAKSAKVHVSSPLSRSLFDGAARTPSGDLATAAPTPDAKGDGATVTELEKEMEELVMDGWILGPEESPDADAFEEDDIAMDLATADKVRQASSADWMAGSSQTSEFFQCQNSGAKGVQFHLTVEEEKFAQCPPGRYLNSDSEEVRKHRTSRLRKAMCAAKAKGWASGNLRETDAYVKRGYATFESKVWPKPSRCTTLPHEAWSATHVRGRSFYRPDSPPRWMNKWVNKQAKVEFHQNWKVASTSFPDYLQCSFDGEWEQVPALDAIKNDTVVAAAVREPIGRFISAASELLERSLNHWCPSGPCGPPDSFDPVVTINRMLKQTTWLEIAQLNKTSKNGDHLDRLMKALVLDTSCNYYTYACEHLNTQANFVTQNDGGAHDIDVIVKLEDLDTGLHKLSAAANTSYRSNCEMKHTNVKTDKPVNELVPTSADMLRALQQNKVLMQKLCLIYAQDFVCFNYTLPPVCHGLF